MRSIIQPILLNPQEVGAIQQELGKTSLLGRSLDALIRDTDAYLAQSIDVPGHSPAGGYAHNRHQHNGKYIDQAGRLFLITGDEKYAQFAAQLLTKYADKYLELGFQEQRNTNPPGRLFHQILNEHVWLLYVSLGFNCISHWLSDTQREHIIGETSRYHVVDHFVANKNDGSLAVSPDLHALILITCYPFNALQTGGPLRYVVVAQSIVDEV